MKLIFKALGSIIGAIILILLEIGRASCRERVS